MLTAHPSAPGASGADGALELPEELRVTDLSSTRSVTRRDLRRLYRQAVAAIEWGPARRNGCRRTWSGDGRVPTWQSEATGRLHMPDQWTPAVTVNGYAYWWNQGYLVGRPGDQPGLITPRGLTWFAIEGEHRAHAPAAITAATRTRALRRRAPRPVWWWKSSRPDEALHALLDHAWADTAITDPDAQTLLARAAALPHHDDLRVDPEVWVAHVLAGNPSPHLSSALRGWLTLLLA